MVYDLERHQAHCLNASAAAVFARCDGRTELRDLATQLCVALGDDVDERWVGLAVDQLGKAHLLEPIPVAAPPVNPGRREMLRHAGIGAALLLPAVVSMVAPTPAEAATCISINECTDTNIGQDCYISDPATECALLECKGLLSCAL